MNSLTVDHFQQREGHWAIIDLRGKAGHVRTIPVPNWVRDLLDDWMKAAGITSGSLFRRVSSAGKVWGEKVTEKLVWHVVKEFAAKIGVGKLAPHDLRGVALDSVVPQAANWSRSNFSSATSRYRRPSATWAAPNEFHPPSTTASA